MPSSSDVDHQVRLAAFRFLEEQKQLRGEVLPREVLSAGFAFEGQRVPLVGPLGEMPLSITTVPGVEGKPRLYDDQVADEGLVRYRYRGTDAGNRDNAGMRLAMQRQAPLVYLYGVVPGTVHASWPVYVVGRAGRLASQGSHSRLPQ